MVNTAYRLGYWGVSGRPLENQYLSRASGVSSIPAPQYRGISITSRIPNRGMNLIFLRGAVCLIHRFAAFGAIYRILKPSSAWCICLLFAFCA